jgi:predicted nucleotide-binding protein
MKNKRNYPYTFFSVEILVAALAQLEKIQSAKKSEENWYLSTAEGRSQWHYDSVDEFYADYRKRPYYATLLHRARYGLVLDVSVHGESTSVEVEAADRAKIESVFSVFENALESSRLPKPSPPAPPKPAIFIGQGHSPVWRDLKDHLHEHHGYQVEAYETGARAGHAIRDILAELVDVSSFALLVLTAEDEHADGTMHARENIIHEAGLFQGRLEYGRAILLLEEGVSEFSNIAGVHQIRFSKGDIRETYGDVLATLRREFPPQVE